MLEEASAWRGTIADNPAALSLVLRAGDIVAAEALGTDGSIPAQVADAAYRACMKKVSEQRIGKGIAAPGDGPGELLFCISVRVPAFAGAQVGWIGNCSNGPDKFRLLARVLDHVWG